MVAASQGLHARVGRDHEPFVRFPQFVKLGTSVDFGKKLGGRGPVGDFRSGRLPGFRLVARGYGNLLYREEASFNSRRAIVEQSAEAVVQWLVAAPRAQNLPFFNVSFPVSLYFPREIRNGETGLGAGHGDVEKPLVLLPFLRFDRTLDVLRCITELSDKG